MRQFIRAAAIAATLLLAPVAASTQGAAVPAGVMTSDAADAFRAAVGDGPRFGAPMPGAPAPSDSGLPASRLTAGDPALAPGQSEADYEAWLAGDPRRRAEVAAFSAQLAAQGLADVVPVWQLIRTSSSWRQCAAQRFEVAPRDKWAHIADTLRFVRDEVVPVIGPVEALSGYRNEALNACSDGAPQSAHRLFFAIDLTPVNPAITRAAMIRSICAAHVRDGRAYENGLGFYTGRRFHVDSNGYRQWGPDGRGATSPCATGRYA
jgi:hypothetical protein